MSPESIVDIGANLTHENFARDLDEVLAAAKSAGVVVMVVTGASVAGSRDALALARRHPGVLYATAGVHPHHARDWQPGDEKTLQALQSEPEVRAAGECGLDHFRNFSTPLEQERVFRSQLEIACETGQPVFLHQRDAHADFLRILDEYLPRLSRAVAHCFTGEAGELDACLERDLYIGITGWICDERRGRHLRQLVSRIPDDRLMIETDAPYLLPRDLKPKPATRRNEPKYLVHVLEAVARAGGRSAAEMADVTRAASATFFALSVND